MTTSGTMMRSGSRAALGQAGSACVLSLVLVVVFLVGAHKAHATNVREITSPKGIKAWLVEEHRVPIVALRFTFEGGAAQDPAGQAGLTSLLADAMMEGAGGLDAAALKEAIARLGLRFSLTAGRDAVYGGVEVVSARLEPAADLLQAILSAPALKADDVERVKAQRLTDISRDAANPATVATRQWYAAAFPDHPYGNPVDGRSDTVPRLAPDALRAQHARQFARDNLKVVIVGDVEPAVASRVLDAIFGALPEKSTLVPIAAPVLRSDAGAVVADAPAALANAVFGLPSLEVNDPDYAALRVLNHVLGSGDLDSLLMDEIRVKRGLAYSADTRLQNDRIGSFLIGRFATRNGSMKQALGVVREVLSRTAQNGPTQAQFENARSFIAGSALIDTDTSARLAGALLDIWRDGEGPDALYARSEKVRAVSLADVKRVAARVLTTDKLLVSIAGDPS